MCLSSSYFFIHRNIYKLQWESDTELNNYLTDHKTSDINGRPCTQQHYFILSHLRYFGLLKFWSLAMFTAKAREREDIHVLRKTSESYISLVKSILKNTVLLCYWRAFWLVYDVQASIFIGIFWNKVTLSFSKGFLRWSENSATWDFLIACIF